MITLKTLRAMAGGSVRYQDLSLAVQRAAVDAPSVGRAGAAGRDHESGS
jgi:hypothetical protein